MGDLQAIREEQRVLSHRSKDHEDKIQALEKIHPEGRHAAK